MADKKDLTIPLNYSGYLILHSLQKPAHGYQMMQYIERATAGQLTVGPATMYRTIADFLERDYIQLVSEEGARKQYVLTERGKALLEKQDKFIELLYNMTKENP